jgi:hypothetical protein
MVMGPAEEVIAQTDLTSGVGWGGASLLTMLGAVLFWLFYKYLPDQRKAEQLAQENFDARIKEMQAASRQENHDLVNKLQTRMMNTETELKKEQILLRKEIKELSDLHFACLKENAALQARFQVLESKMGMGDAHSSD